MSMRSLRISEGRRLLSIFTKLKRLLRKAEVNMPEAKGITRLDPYASSADFCRIFEEDMNGLYLLSFLLTADHAKAEQCFVSGLEDAASGNPVFKEWARSWARRAIIQNAVRVINPRPTAGHDRSRPVSVEGGEKKLSAEKHVQTAAVLALEPFERFVYVMTVLEGYSDQECSLLLGCVRRDVVAAQSRALQQLGSLMQRYSQLASLGLQTPSSHQPTAHERSSSVLELLIATQLATPA
jgi:hypothetical protein